jgi:polyvinyl alcohol dehydrogenase (cytochrome)
MKIRLSVIALCFSTLFCVASLHAQDGAVLFNSYCASCHEEANNSTAPDLEILRKMSPEQILQALEKGAMKAQAAERSRAQRRVLAEYLSGKAFGADNLNPIPKSAFCSATVHPFVGSPAGPTWNGWGASISNARFQSSDAAAIKSDDIPRLKLKWAFGFPGASSGGTQPVVVGGRVYVGDAEGDLFSLDAQTGCIHWTIEVEAGVRSAITIGKKDTAGLVAYFGDQAANVYAVDAESGKVLWKVKVDEHPRAAITGAPQLYAGRLYVPVSSREESMGGDPTYPCCRFRGSVVALEAASGKQLWKTYTVEKQAVPTEKNKAGTQLWGPSGAAVWNAPTVDVKRNMLYVGTGNNYSPPSTPTSDSIVALDMNSGKIRWVHQVTEADVWNGSCRRTNRDPAVCPDKDAPDTDFPDSPILVELKNGQQLIVAGNKSRLVLALDPDHKGKRVWEQRVGKGVFDGGVMWGTAADTENMYVANADYYPDNPGASGGITAIDLATGRVKWSTMPPPCGDRKPCKPSQAAAVTGMPGVVFSGTMDGQLRAYSTDDGKIIWDYNTARDYTTVNGVKAKGGSMSNAGPAVVGGMLFVNSGYSHHGGIIPGNVLLTFSLE